MSANGTPSYLDDSISAKLVWRAAESKALPGPEVEKRLTIEWREAIYQAEQDGTHGIQNWLGDIAERNPTMVGVYKHALDSTEKLAPEPSEFDVNRATVQAEASQGQVTDLDRILAGLNRTDLGNAERFVSRHGKRVRYCHVWKKWLPYDGTRWAIDQSASVRTLARDTVRHICFEAGTLADKEDRAEHAKHGLSSESRSRISSMLELAEAERKISILPSDMDRDGWLFNFKNGTLDLRTGVLRKHRRLDYLTKVCPFEYDPKATCPLWLKTLETFLVDPEVIAYFRRIIGCAMAGVIRDHILPIAYGVGSNGKSTILNTLMAAFGPDYAMKAPPDLLMARRGESHPTERADLFGKRLVVAIETEAGRRLNETLVKELTGGDPIRTRRMREDFWEFLPTHTVILATNHRPKISGTDNGIWRRPKLIPFTVTMPDDQADKSMPEKLLAEIPGILAWCVQGCLEWQADGLLKTPRLVAEATASYRSEQDTLAAFIEEHLVDNREARSKVSAVYAAYKDWAEKSGESTMSMKAFSVAIQERGYETKKSSGMWFMGIGLRSMQTS